MYCSIVAVEERPPAMLEGMLYYKTYHSWNNSKTRKSRKLRSIIPISAPLHGKPGRTPHRGERSSAILGIRSDTLGSLR